MEGDKSKEEEVMSEVTERSMEANMKILVGNEISHAKRVDVIAEKSLQDAVNLAEKGNNAYLERNKQMADAYMEHCNQLHSQLIENNRFTLDRLYGMFPEEAAGTSMLVKLTIEALRQSGWTPPANQSK